MKFTSTITALALVFASTNAAPTTPLEPDTESPNPSAVLKRQLQHVNECDDTTWNDQWYDTAPSVDDCLTMVEKQTVGYYNIDPGWKKVLSWGSCAFSARLASWGFGTDEWLLFWRYIGDDDVWDLTREGILKHNFPRDGKVAFGGAVKCAENSVIEWKVHRN